ncbi:hypothetical protein JHW43_002789 [Diplocarpon mali]|nr:hypothetical protein JHW43_002789 [Diplocarpon mali]
MIFAAVQHPNSQLPGASCAIIAGAVSLLSREKSRLETQIHKRTFFFVHAVRSQKQEQEHEQQQEQEQGLLVSAAPASPAPDWIGTLHGNVNFCPREMDAERGECKHNIPRLTVAIDSSPPSSSPPLPLSPKLDIRTFCYPEGQLA